MADRLTHRGPDAAGAYTDEHRRVALAFRRLAIIDLATGMQPIANEDATIHAVVNGEIYNFQALRENLARQGHRFTTAGDIEPVVHLYEEYGTEFLNHLDGFFALALYDARNHRLILAVDPAGKKPIYYTAGETALAFASELKALQPVRTNTVVSKPALIDYLRYGYIPAPETIYSQVRKLPPGHRLELHLDYQTHLAARSLPPPVSYVHSTRRTRCKPYPVVQGKLSDLLTRAVAKRLVADVPVGVLLSGGIDSAVVTALACQVGTRPVKTFSVGFASELYNELPLANLVAERYRTDHTPITIEPDLESMLDQVIATYDEPFADSSAIPTALVCREAARHVRVVLTGDGGDEAFLGYDRYRAMAMTTCLHRLQFTGKLLPFQFSPGPELRSLRTRLWRMGQALNLPPANRYSQMMRLFFEPQLENLLGSELAPGLRHPDLVAWSFDRFTDEFSFVARANRCDYATYLPGDLLVKIDRASMANSLEVRSPFLDRAVIDFARSLPVRYKMAWAHGKRIVRDTFRHLLPEPILRQPKRGFGVPMGQWLRGPLREQMEKVLSPTAEIVRREFIRRAVMDDLIAQHRTGKFDHGPRLWALMVLERFLASIR